MKEKIRSFLKRIVPRLPRKWRVIRNLVCILLAVYLIWLFSGSQSLTPLWAFRRAERESLVGPSEVVYRTKQDDRVLVYGKANDGYLAGNAHRELGWDCVITYWEKGGTVTLVPVSKYGMMSEADRVQMLLFHEMNGAVRGEAEVTLDATVSFHNPDGSEEEGSVTETYRIQFEPCGEQVLTGWIEPHFPDDDSLESKTEKYAMATVLDSNENLSFEVWLYDGEGNVVYHDTIEYSYADI